MAATLPAVWFWWILSVAAFGYFTHEIVFSDELLPAVSDASHTIFGCMHETDGDKAFSGAEAHYCPLCGGFFVLFPMHVSCYLVDSPGLDVQDRLLPSPRWGEGAPSNRGPPLPGGVRFG